MKLCIVDDEKNCIDNLRSILEKYCEDKGLDAEIDTFYDKESFIAAYKPETYDICFLDIYIGNTTGMELAGHIRTLSENGMIIFCTTSVSDMPQAFRYHAFEYIIKPAEYDRVSSVMDDAIAILPNLEKYIDFLSGKDRIHLALSSISSVTTSGHYLDITTKNGEVTTVRLTLTEFNRLVEGEERFLIINKGIVINLDHVKNIADKNCVMSTGDVFPIKVREAVSIKRHWQDYKIAMIRKGQGNNT